MAHPGSGHTDGMALDAHTADVRNQLTELDDQAAAAKSDSWAVKPEETP